MIESIKSNMASQIGARFTGLAIDDVSRIINDTSTKYEVSGLVIELTKTGSQYSLGIIDTVNCKLGDNIYPRNGFDFFLERATEDVSYELVFSIVNNGFYDVLDRKLDQMEKYMVTMAK